MSSPWNVKSLAAAIAVVVALGVTLDLTRDSVEAPADDIGAPAGAFQTRAAFCPPAFDPSKSTQTIAMAADPGTAASIRIQPEQQQSNELPEGRLLLHRIEGPPVDAIAYGSRLHAASMLRGDSPVTGSDAARCPRVVSDKWFFPAGSSSLGYDERIMIRNPFPDEAVVKVTFFTPTGRTTKANLAEVAVPAGNVVFLRVNNFILRQPVLGASVEAQRGRVVAWRALFAEPENRPDGIYFGLGATSPSLEWYFPEGAVGTGLEEIITLLNPHRQEAIVSVALATDEGRVNPPKLVEVRIPPNSIRTLSLPEVLGARDSTLGSVGAMVGSTNGVGVVAERTVWYAAGRTGVSSQIGTREAALSWLVLPAAVASTDDALVVLNPGSARATVDVTLLSQEGQPRRPDELQSIQIRPGARRRIALTELTGGQPVAAIVSSDQAVVAERVAISGNGDVTTLMGEVMRTAP